MNKPRFNLKNKDDKESLIVLVFRLRGERYVYSTGMKVPPKFWNDKAMRVRASQEYLDFEYMNKQLERVEAATITISRKYESQGSILTQMAFKGEMDAILTGQQKTGSVKDFTSFLNEFIEDRGTSPKYSQGSIEVYNTARKHIVKFVKSRPIKYEDLSIEFFKDFIRFLYKQDFSDNHVNKILSTIRTVLNEATERGLNKNLAYKSRKISVGKTETDNVYLTEDDLSKLVRLDLNARPSLDRVRDLFVIGAYTGLRFSDFTNLKPENLQMLGANPTFNVLTKKTKDRLVIPVHPLVKNVLEKYAFTLPDPISNQKMNDALKEICKIAGLDKVVTKRHYKGGAVYEEKYLKWQLVSSHTGRRSFATNTYKAGVPMLSIMRITGHKKPETFLKYIKFDNTENAILMANHPFFIKYE